MRHHDIHHVSGLPYGEYPYEDRFASSFELESQMKSKGIGTYWEILCHFHICMDKHKRRKEGSPLLSERYILSTI